MRNVLEPSLSHELTRVLSSVSMKSVGSHSNATASTYNIHRIHKSVKNTTDFEAQEKNKVLGDHYVYEYVDVSIVTG